MPKRAMSKKRAAEAEKEIDMDDKEATPVEDIEGRLPPVSYTHLDVYKRQIYIQSLKYKL